MKKLYFFMLAMMAVIAANATTVYFENTANWATVKAYAWKPNNADWPGVTVSETVNVTVQGSNATKTLYKYELPGAQENIIFNNGSGAQTKDLAATDGAVYSFEANSNSTRSIGTVSGNKFIPAGEAEITYGKIYVPVKMYDHATAYIYSWSPSVFGSWPGKQMTKVTENGIDFWMVEVDEAELPATVGGWVLSEGSDTGKTGDLPSVTFQKDYVYEPTGTVTPLADYRPSTEDVVVYAIHGQIFGKASWESYDMTEENGVWSYTGNAVPGSFGIKKMVNGSQTDWYAADDDARMTEAKEYDAKVNGNNWNSTLVGNYTFTFDPEALTLTVIANSVEEPTITYALKGTIFGGENWASYDMTEKDGVWSYTGNAQLGDFGIQKLANGSQIEWLFAQGDKEMKANDVYPVTNADGANWHNMLTGEVTFAFNPDAMTLTVSGGTYEEVEQKWYVSYDINNAGWEFNKEMTADPSTEGVYYADFDNLTAERNYFTFTDAPMNNWSVTGGKRYGPEGDADVEIEVDKAYTLHADSQKCFVAAPGKARITLNTNDMTIKCSGKLLTVISIVEADSNAAAEYFNLQGVRIANPVKGQLVIERRGTVATKRIF